MVQQFWDQEDEQDQQSQPKKPKKKQYPEDEAKAAAARKVQEEEEHRKKRKKEKEKEAQEAKLRAEEERQKAEELEETTRMAQQKLFAIVRREKYMQECPELIAYWKKHITEAQRNSVNLDDHSAYLNSVWEDTSLYPHGNVMSCAQLIKKLSIKPLGCTGRCSTGSH